MKAKFRFLLALCLAVPVLAGCDYVAHEQLTALNYAVPSGKPFVQRLAVEYRDMANQYHDQDNDMSDAAHFSRKGLQASSGTKKCCRKNPDDWWVADDELNSMRQGRETLMAVL